MNYEPLLFMFVLLIVIDILITVITIFDMQKTQKKLSGALVCVTLYTILLAASYGCMDVRVVAVIRSMSHILIDIALCFMLRYVIDIIGETKSQRYSILFSFYLTLLIADSIFLFVDGFTGILTNYSYDATIPLHWITNYTLFYGIHIVLTYLVIITLIIVVIFNSRRLATIYRKTAGILIVSGIAFLAIYLFAVSACRKVGFELSGLVLSVYLILAYYIMFYYSRRSVLNEVNKLIVNEIGHPAFMFDYCNRLILANADANVLYASITGEKLESSGYSITNIQDDSSVTLEKVCKKLGIDRYLTTDMRETFFQWNLTKDGIQRSYRVNYRPYYDAKKRLIGRLFIFTDSVEEMDLLTGFHSRETFQHFYQKSIKESMYPLGVLVCDIESLASIHEIADEEADKTIRFLADTMIRNCPPESYFIRMSDLTLVAICPSLTQEQVKELNASVNQTISSDNSFSEPLTVLCSSFSINSIKQDVVQTVKNAIVNMNTSKTARGIVENSSMLNSILQMQFEADESLDAHGKRTRTLCEMLGKKLGLSDMQQRNLSLVCLLHDVGKVGIPTEIINKPTGLTGKEWELMRSHVERGYRICLASKELEDISLSVLHHHECWNGTGYPDGLQKESIPLLARIISIVDTYDAMTNDRPYRKALPPAVARSELKSCAGSQFDPYIVKAFVDMLNELAPIDLEEEYNIRKLAEANTKPMGTIKRKEIEAAGINVLKYTSYVLGKDGSIISVDDGFERITGYSYQDVKEQKLTQTDLIFKEDLEAYLAKTTALLERDNEAYVEHRLRRKDGKAKRVFCYGREFFDPISREERCSVLVTDISENDSKMSEGVIDKKAEVDALTGVFSRKSFDQLVSQLFKNSQEDYLLLLVDVDEFRQFNRNYGYVKGDEILKFISDCTLQIVGNDGIVGRISGDRFCIVIGLEDRITEEEIRAKQSDIWETLMQALHANSKDISISMGGVYAPCGKYSYEQALAASLEALMGAKQQGRKSYCMYAGNKITEAKI